MLRWQILIAGAFAAYFLFRYLPSALLFVWPGLLRTRETEDDGSLDPGREPAMERVHAGLVELGFARAGAIQVSPPLSAGWAELVYAAPALHAFADVDVRGGAVAVTLLTPFEGGQAVLTSDFRRATTDRADYLAGGLPGSDIPALWAAHRRRVEHFHPPGAAPAPWTDFSIAGRVRADEVVTRGAGRRELRQRSAAPLMYVLLALALLAESALQLVRQVGRG
ncbi:MAG: hypothetical protein ACYDCL_00960 [Myxococcales bacterium]